MPADEPTWPPVAQPDTTWEADPRVYASGEWHERHDNWRDEIDLGACDNMTAYAAGRLDGHQQATSEFYGIWKLLRPFHEYVTPRAARR